MPGPSGLPEANAKSPGTQTRWSATRVRPPTEIYWNWAQAAAARGAQGEALWALLRARELDPGDRAVSRDVQRLREALNLDPAEIAPEPLAAVGRFARRFRLDLVALALLAVSVLAHGLARLGAGLPASAASMVRREFLKCGLLEHGFARLWCSECRRSVLVAFSCRGRSFCPSCEKKKQLLWAEWLQEVLLALHRAGPGRRRSDRRARPLRRRNRRAARHRRLHRHRGSCGIDFVVRDLEAPLVDPHQWATRQPVLSIDEGTFEGERWVPGRRLNGDERWVRLPDEGAILRVRLRLP